jgi:hypothetical protein
VVQGEVSCAWGAIEADEDHQGRRQLSIESEIVGAAGAHGLGQLEAGLGEEGAGRGGEGGVVDRSGFSFCDLYAGDAAVGAGCGVNDLARVLA